VNYKDIYQQKLTTPEEAVKLVEDGWRVTWPVMIKSQYTN
jgi:acyl-CoA hydrolase